MPAATKASVRKGILAGGNWIIDQVKMIDVYPQREQLANITGATVTGSGGSPYNLLINLAKLGVDPESAWAPPRLHRCPRQQSKKGQYRETRGKQDPTTSAQTTNSLVPVRGLFWSLLGCFQDAALQSLPPLPVLQVYQLSLFEPIVQIGNLLNHRFPVWENILF